MSGFTSYLKRSKWAVKDAIKQDRPTGPFFKAPEGELFPKVDSAIDGEDCDRDCEDCTIKYPAKFSIDEEEALYGHVKGWATHLIVATGKTDWVRDVADEKGSVMEAVEKADKPLNGRLMLSASNIPTPSDSTDYSEPTTCLLLPAFVIIDNVTPTNVPDLISSVVNKASTSTSLLSGAANANGHLETELSDHLKLPSGLSTRSCPRDVVILICSQKTRDARCGQSAPLLKREFERHLRALGLYRDTEDERPGGVGIHFISHVGGHKFSANVMIYRRPDFGRRIANHNGNGHVPESAGITAEEESKAQDLGASQCIWIARVRPEDCQGIVKFTVMQGKVVKPERQLRGGFDREKGLCSW